MNMKTILLREDVKSLQPLTNGALYRSLVKWAARQPEMTFIVEAETGRELPYSQTLTAVNALRELLGNIPRCIVLALPGGIANAVVWISALNGGHQLIPLSQVATKEEKARVAQK